MTIHTCDKCDQEINPADGRWKFKMKNAFSGVLGPNCELCRPCADVLDNLINDWLQAKTKKEDPPEEDGEE